MLKVLVRPFALTLLAAILGPSLVSAQSRVPFHSVAQDPASPTQGAAPQAPATPPQGAQAQNPAQTSGNKESAPTICGNPIPPPRNLPPEGSGPVVYIIAPCFAKQGGNPNVESETYLYYIQLRPSQPSQNVWVPYDQKAEQTILEDFKRLWATSFLDDLSVEVTDYRFSNGVIGKLVTYDMEERERVKIVSYEGSKKIERTKIDEKLKELGIQLRLDSFLDPGTVRRVEGVLREMMAEKGFQAAEVTHSVTPVAGGPKLVNVTFNIAEGPKVRIRDIEFIGNKAFSDGKLQRKMKENKEKGFLSFITGGGTYKESKFEEDAEKVVQFYREEGYITVRVSQPEVKVLENSADGKTRWIQLRIPVAEGERYRVGKFDFEGNTVVKSEQLRPLFKMTPGEWYSEKKIRKGLEKARELYGTGGYFEFTGYPDLKPENDPNASDGAAQVPEALAPNPAPRREGSKAPNVDITMRLQEGKQYFVDRITFVGNTTTRDNVIRREMRLVEGGVFNTEALKYSVKRLNQLGYFKNLEGEKDIQVEKTPNVDNQVDVTLKLEEQNRNQLTFGAGVSQFEGFFGQLAFQTSNFMGRGESLTLSLQAGSRAQNYQVAFTEPFLFDRNMTGGIDVYRRTLQYIGYYTQKSTGGNIVFGFPVADFSRMFLNYSYEQVKVSDLNVSFNDPLLLARNPFLRDSLLIGEGGKRIISKVVPSFVHNTVDNPIFPTTGRRYTASIDLAGFGGNTNFYKPMVEGIWYLKHTNRTSIGLRAQFEFIAPWGSTITLPIFEKLFLGGEYSVRGYDIRSIGPSDPFTGLVLGGNKSLLFNAEYLIAIAGPVRLVLFYDAGQVRADGDSFSWKEDVTQIVPGAPTLFDPFARSTLKDPSALGPETVVVGTTSAFKTSTGAEIRFFMPVLNVPFRLIFAMNPQRTGVLDNNLQPAKKFTFKFAVGSTF
jgi:outer membrane protein insertion porin family